jgi:hypothetical protein
MLESELPHLLEESRLLKGDPVGIDEDIDVFCQSGQGLARSIHSRRSAEDQAFPERARSDPPQQV